MSATLATPVRPWALRLLPHFPHVASRVLALVTDEDTATRKVSEIIRTDPSFTAEILRIANSALYGRGRQITTVALAVTRLGLERTKACATLFAVNSMVKPVLRLEALRKCWVHSLVSAIVTEELARAAGVPTGTAYTVGLLHDLGTLGLMAAYPEEYNRMLEVSTEYGFDMVRTERDLFEIDHCAAGAYLADEWNFPDEMGVAIATHHLDPNPGDASLNSLVRLGWRLADALGYQAFAMDQLWSYEDLVDAAVDASGSWLGRGAEEARAELADRLSQCPM